jgi:lysozyme family protein
MNNSKLQYLLVLTLSLFCLTSNAASFEIYFKKLMKFEGSGYGIHKPIWGNQNFTMKQAYKIHKVHYWNKYKGDLFESQEVAEVFIDHLINAGEGRESVNIKAFEAIIGAEQDGIVSKDDVEKANNFVFFEQIVNPYINYRVYYYMTLKNHEHYRGWFVRAKSFQVYNDAGEVISDYLILPKMLDKKLEIFEPQIVSEVVAKDDGF